MKATLITLLTLGSLAMAETENILDSAVYTRVFDATTTGTQEIDLTNLAKSGSFSLTMQLNQAGFEKFCSYIGSTKAAGGQPVVGSLSTTNYTIGTRFGYSSDKETGLIADGGIFITWDNNYRNAQNYLADMRDAMYMGEEVTLTLVHTDKTGTAMDGILFYGFGEYQYEEAFHQADGSLKWQTGLGDWSKLTINTDLVGKVALYAAALDAEQVAASNRAILTMQNVPEPATGTLSLLALAGLAARRRRK